MLAEIFSSTQGVCVKTKSTIKHQTILSKLRLGGQSLSGQHSKPASLRPGESLFDVCKNASNQVIKENVSAPQPIAARLFSIRAV